jgi:6-phosphogluconate dehydrogenase
MELGMIGLGKMGANMAERLVRGGHPVVGYDPNPEAVGRAIEKGVLGAESVEALVEQLIEPRAVWLMLPAGQPVDHSIETLMPILAQGDVLLDGGNSNYKDTLRRAEMLQKLGLHLLDVGTSGGIWGLAEGYCLMIGGERQVVERLHPIFETLAPAPNKGWGYVGPTGSGHFVKMVHNGIEYGLMQSYAEGFTLMRRKEAFNLDLPQIAEIWRSGSVVRSWLLDLLAQVLEENPSMEGITPYVEDSGEGRWTVFEAIDLDVPAPVVSLSLIQRLRSRDAESYSDRLLAALRHKFGGHPIRREDQS